MVRVGEDITDGTKDVGSGAGGQPNPTGVFVVLLVTNDDTNLVRFNRFE